MSRATELLELFDAAPGRKLTLAEIAKEFRLTEDQARGVLDAARDMLNNYDIEWVECKTWKLARRAK